MITAVIQLLTVGQQTGPFYIYSNVDGFSVPFLSNISQDSLIAGYPTDAIPDLTTTVRIKSINNVCNNYIDIPIVVTTTTTTSTTLTPSTTTTTTTTDAPTVNCIEVGIYPPLIDGTLHTVTYINCLTEVEETVNVPFGGTAVNICVTATGIISDNKNDVIAQTVPTGNICIGTVTTTTTIP